MREKKIREGERKIRDGKLELLEGKREIKEGQDRLKEKEQLIQEREQKLHENQQTIIKTSIVAMKALNIDETTIRKEIKKSLTCQTRKLRIILLNKMKRKSPNQLWRLFR